MDDEIIRKPLGNIRSRLSDADILQMLERQVPQKMFKSRLNGGLPERTTTAPPATLTWSHFPQTSLSSIVN